MKTLLAFLFLATTVAAQTPLCLDRYGNISFDQPPFGPAKYWGNPAIIGAGKSVVIPEGGRLWFTGPEWDGSSIYHNKAYQYFGGHYRGQLQINSNHSIALCLGQYGRIQLGIGVANSQQYILSQYRGTPTAQNPFVSSLPHFGQTAIWMGAGWAYGKVAGWDVAPVGDGTLNCKYGIYFADSVPQAPYDVVKTHRLWIYSDGRIENANIQTMEAEIEALKARVTALEP